MIDRRRLPPSFLAGVAFFLDFQPVNMGARASFQVQACPLILYPQKTFHVSFQVLASAHQCARRQT